MLRGGQGIDGAGPGGVMTALVTPFTPEGAVDIGAWERLCTRQIAAGVHGLVVAGTTGESPTLDGEERTLLLASALGLGRPAGTHVCMGVGTNDTRSTVANTRAALEQGADSGLLVLPYYNKPTPAGLRAHVLAAAAVGLPLVVYHVPGRTGQRLAPELLAELCAIPGVVACKEATGELSYAQDFMACLAVRGVGRDETARGAARQGCATLSGDDFTWMPLLAVGGAGVISVLSNIAPRRTVAVWDAWQRGDVGAAGREHASLYTLVRWLFAESNPVPAKMALAAMGLCGPTLRMPLVAGAAPPAGLLDGME
ncbi:MAG: 4-hydroxy-tetrahydrodipicolinate synthase [Myxococcales bacterium]|nr:4-hydroxy-tetrahydrodipicolinate synthase [Myxococcales bacterium]